MTPTQSELNFDANYSETGFHTWHEQRRQATEQLAHRMGLPIGHRVEVWLQGGVRLIGTLKLDQEQLFVAEERDFRLKLVVDGVQFAAAEIEACVRRDD